MQIALNQLLAYAKPHRLLIEPTGLGHPKEVMEVLSAEYYKNVLQIQNIITLVDARKLVDNRYTNHETFNQQIEIADLIIGNKKDLYQPVDTNNLQKYVESLCDEQTPVKLVTQGELELNWLASKSAFDTTHSSQCENEDEHEHSHTHSHSHSHSSDVPAQLTEQSLPESGFLNAGNQGEGFYSEGWRIAPHIEFNQEKLFSWMNSLDVERLKAVFITTDGIFGYNLSDGMLTRMEIDDCLESRIEIISKARSSEYEAALKNCIAN